VEIGKNNVRDGEGEEARKALLGVVWCESTGTDALAQDVGNLRRQKRRGNNAFLPFQLGAKQRPGFLGVLLAEQPPWMKPREKWTKTGSRHRRGESQSLNGTLMGADAIVSPA